MPFTISKIFNSTLYKQILNAFLEKNRKTPTCLNSYIIKHSSHYLDRFFMKLLQWCLRDHMSPHIKLTLFGGVVLKYFYYLLIFFSNPGTLKKDQSKYWIFKFEFNIFFTYSSNGEGSKEKSMLFRHSLEA